MSSRNEAIARPATGYFTLDLCFEPMKASLAGWTEILQIYAAYLAQRSSETGAVSGVLVYTITSVAKGGILSRCTILPAPIFSSMKPHLSLAIIGGAWLASAQQAALGAHRGRSDRRF